MDNRTSEFRFLDGFTKAKADLDRDLAESLQSGLYVWRETDILPGKTPQFASLLARRQVF